MNIALLKSHSEINGRLPPFLVGTYEPTEPPTKSVPSLSCSSEESLDYFAGKAKKMSYPKGAVIVSEGNVSSSFFIILSGKVRVFSSSNAKEVTHSIQLSGSYFGETSLLTNEPLLVTVMALEKTVCMVIAKGDFINWLMAPNVAFAFLGMLSGIISHLTDKVKQLALLNVYERIVQTLLEMAVDEGDVRVIHNRPTQQELAFMVGASREMVGKIMHDLSKGGYMEVLGKHIFIYKDFPSSW
jgi:CRP/FNR family transcriptional regulator, cyclic AMP receptor protein